MGRGRGKGKKTAVASHEDPASGGEELLPAYKRRGRPQKLVKDDIDEDGSEKVEEEGDAVKPITPIKEVKGLTLESGKKRKKYPQVKENSYSAAEENGASIISNNEELTKSNGFRQVGSRRKSKPRRAAEAGVECS